ncbi:DUF3810 domain-containing protein [Clostridium estertheticum]|uniref:DUF3810 domain-containing protein n=1 Tax=Clostridium estertheticum TaxID=238834 RepID=UPI001C0AE219|nr:DUF3810 domain-containing protein [Clostridium estertheticum]MBU3177436.1 DUF3810 domain-containing protein [Clostridium estertheticum]
MKFSLSRKQLFLILLLPIGILLTQLCRVFPNFTERFYSLFIYKIIVTNISSITGFFPFSLAECIIISFSTFVLWYIYKTIFSLLRHKNKRTIILKNMLLNALAISGLIYFSFQLLWGFNYQRLPLAKTLKLDVHNSTTNELAHLCKDLITSSNTLREKISQNKNGVMELPYNKKVILETAHLGYDKASLQFVILKGTYGAPKGILFSHPMCYTGITGFYFPFTSEININIAEPDSYLPFTISHEMAHQIGFAKEDEANFIAYIACINNPDINFKYSGTLAALTYSLGSLRQYDPQKYKELISVCSKGVLNDMLYNENFWKNYSGCIEKISEGINDTYLKSASQRSGLKSYSAMVDLLLANYRKK